MKISNPNAADKVAVRDVPAGACFEHEGHIYLRIATIELMPFHEKCLRNVVGVSAEHGSTYFTDNPEDMESVQVTWHPDAEIVLSAPTALQV